MNIEQFVVLNKTALDRGDIVIHDIGCQINLEMIDSDTSFYTCTKDGHVVMCKALSWFCPHDEAPEATSFKAVGEKGTEVLNGSRPVIPFDEVWSYCSKIKDNMPRF